MFEILQDKDKNKFQQNKLYVNKLISNISSLYFSDTNSNISKYPDGCIYWNFGINLNSYVHKKIGL